MSSAILRFLSLRSFITQSSTGRSSGDCGSMKIAQDVYGHSVLCAYLYPRHYLYPELFPRLGGFKISGLRIMIRYRDGF